MDSSAEEVVTHRVRDFRTLADRVHEEMEQQMTPAAVTKFPSRPASSRARTEGSVRKIKQDRGYGFIAGDDGIDYFFHWSAMDKASKNFRELDVQERVSFEAVHITDPTTGENKYRAIKIRVE